MIKLNAVLMLQFFKCFKLNRIVVFVRIVTFRDFFFVDFSLVANIIQITNILVNHRVFIRKKTFRNILIDLFSRYHSCLVARYCKK